jgi:CubicO group peptidase (beta-lactamase class C family)/dienelactone hydrolase
MRSSCIVGLVVGLVIVGSPVGSEAEEMDPAVEARVQRWIETSDANGDGKLQREEVPERMAPLVIRLDADRDGALNADELAILAARMGGAQPGARAPESSSGSSAASSELVKGSSSRYDFSRVDEFLLGALDRMGGGGALMLIQDGQVIYRKSFGADWTPERAVPIASASKGISAGVIMALVDEGKLSLDDHYSKYLPEYTGKYGQITIRQGFSHTHGFPEGPQHHRDTSLTMAECVKKFLDIPLIADPGTALYYSGIGMQIDGRIAEIVTGKQWVEIFTEKIGDPLDMKSTTYYAFGETENPNVAGSVQTTIDDYGSFTWMLANGGVYEGKRVLSEAAVRTMLSNQTDDLPVKRHPAAAYAEFDADFASSRYGVGWWLEDMDADGNASEATSGGAFGCQPFVDLERNLAGVYLPYARQMRRIGQNLAINDATVVYLELREIIRDVIPEMGATSGGGGASVAIAEATWHDAERNRDVPVRVYAPPLAEGDGSFPLIVFSHGFGESRESYESQGRHWAGHGYIVIAATHAGSDTAALQAARGGGWTPAPFDVRPEDVSFIIDRALAEDQQLEIVRGRVDPDRIGVAGHSMGSSTALAMIGFTAPEGDGGRRSFADERVRCAIAQAPQIGSAAGTSGRASAGRLERFIDADSWSAISKPAMVMFGSRDTGYGVLASNPMLRRTAFDNMPAGDKYLTILGDAQHHIFTDTDPYYGGDPRDPRHVGWIHRLTTAFFDAYLKGDAEARAWLQSEALEEETAGEVTIEHK